MSILKEMYGKKVVPALRERFKYKNVMQVPRLQKIVLNMALGHEKINKDRKIVDEAVNTLTAITGQRAIATKAKKAIAAFQSRANPRAINCMVLYGIMQPLLSKQEFF